MDIHMSPPSCGRIFKGNIWGRAAGYMTFFWLVGGEVTGWNSRNANHQPSGSNQSGVSACTDCYHLLPGWWPCCCQVASVVSNSVRPHRRQPTRLPRPWDSPGKNTGVGCHFLLQGMNVKSESEVTQSCPTLHGPMDCSLPGSSIHGIFQAKVLEWGAIAFS